jgi:hypothetical protein
VLRTNSAPPRKPAEADISASVLIEALRTYRESAPVRRRKTLEQAGAAMESASEERSVERDIILAQDIPSLTLVI